jgi:hypothetical protein
LPRLLGCYKLVGEIECQRRYVALVSGIHTGQKPNTEYAMGNDIWKAIF